MTSNDPLLRPYPSGRPSYFVLLQWSGEEILNIRDFRYARYAIEDAEVIAA